MAPLHHCLHAMMGSRMISPTGVRVPFIIPRGPTIHYPAWPHHPYNNWYYLDGDMLQLCQILIAAIFKPGRKLYALTKFIFWFIDKETNIAGRNLEENASRHAEID